MQTENSKLLLTDYKLSDEPYQLIINKYSTEHGKYSDYFIKLINKFSAVEVSSILEIFPSEDVSLQMNLRKNGFNVTSIPFKLDIKAVVGEKDGEHFVLGESYTWPKSNESFDAILVTLGVFGSLINLNDIKDFITFLAKVLNHSGLLLLEIWHIGGIDQATSTEKGHKEWEKIESKNDDLTITRLIHSKLNILKSILDVDIKYIIEHDTSKTVEKFNETHLWRLYSIPEIVNLFTEHQFEFKAIYKMNSFEEPEFKTFRMMLILAKI